MINIAVLISDKGTGTNLQAIIDGIKKGNIKGKLTVVISDTPKAIGLKRAKKNKIKVEICPNKNQLATILKKYQPDHIALAGWKQIVTDEVIKAFTNEILNLHPGLIPDKINGKVKNPDGSNALWNRGLLAEKAVNNFLTKKATYAGSSIHFLTNEFDFGPVLARTFIKIKKADTVDSLYGRLKKQEHRIYVEVLQKLSDPIKFTVLVVDDGGRASALVDKYAQSPNVDKLLAVPGNDLITKLVKKPVKIFPHLKTTDTKEIIKICKKEKVDLIDVAQDDAIEAGLVDSLTKSGFKVFGPTKAAGQIEWDKAWSRNYMRKYKIPHPSYKVCKSEKEGINYVKKHKDAKWFVKASGLAAGKGAILAESRNEAISAIKSMKNFGKAGETFLIEQYLTGEEFSAFAQVSGKQFEIIGYAQDNKKVFDNDLGPNTGGMGCSSPPMAITKQIESQVKSIFKKTVDGLVKIGRPYLGILYLGGIIDKDNKVWVIEFNARWGDPEAQVLIPAIKNDFWDLALNAIKGKLQKINKDNIYRIVITVASKGYPGDYSGAVGKKINGLNKLVESNRVKIYGAGVKVKNGQYLANGGRLFYVLAEGKNVAIARKIAYNALSLTSIESGNLHYRTDIGYRDKERLS